ncbi:MAG: TIGR02099 family protein [Burkholderiales bacterium]|nr:TIGR02099 family protein [Burkholderiales bacterium]
MPFAVSSLPARFSHFAALCRTSWHVSHRSLKLFLLTTLWSLLAVWWVLGAAFLVLRYGILPDINHYKPRIEQEMSRALGLGVSIGKIEADWSGLRPELSLSQVVLRQTNNTVALEVPRIDSRLSWWSLPVLAPRFSALMIESPEVDVVRVSEQRWRVAGIELDLNKPADNRFAEWLLSQREIIIQGALIRYHDEVLKTQPVELRKIMLVLQNSVQQHRVAFQATPPSTLASPLDIRAEFEHRFFTKNIADWREWSGVAYANFDYADIVALKAYIPWSLPANTQINSAKGALRAWVQFERGRLGQSTADLALRDVSLQFDKSLPILKLAQLRGRLLAQQLQDDQRHGHEIQINNLAFQTADGAASAALNFSERLWFDDQGQVSAGQLSASEVDLNLLTRLAAFLPLPEQYRNWLEQYAPRGKLQGLSTEWQGPWSKPTHYSLQSGFQQLSWRAQRPNPDKAPTAPHHFNFGLPGFENLTGQLKLNEQQGELKLNSANSALFFPGVFERERIDLDRLVAQLDWRRSEQGWLLNLQQLSLANQDAAGNFKGTYRPGGKAGLADIEGQLLRVDARAVQHYLPLTIPELTRNWVRQAVLAGGSNDVRFRLQGDLYDWPYHKTGNGQFLISAKLQNTQLKVAPDWPILNDVRGDLIFEKNGFRVENAVASAQGLRASGIKAQMPDFSEPSHTLELRGNLQGSMKAYFDFINNSPVDRWLNQALSEARGSGDARTEIQAELPLSRIVDTKVRGTMTFAGNDLKLVPGLPSFARTTGKLDFSETGAALRNVNTQFLGGNLKLETPALAAAGASYRGFQVRGEGNASLSAISRLLGLDHVLGKSSGSTRYLAQLGVQRGQLEWSIDSDLTGWTLNLPAPLSKNSGDTMPLRLQSRPTSQAGQEELRLSLGQQLTMVLEKNQGQRVSRGQIQIGETLAQTTPTLPAQGLAFNIAMRQMDLDAWNALLEREGGAGSEASLMGWSWPGQTLVSLKTDELRLAGRRFSRINATATRRDFGWFITIDSPQIQGNLAWRKGSTTVAGTNPGRAVGRFAKLSLPNEETEEVVGLLEAAQPQEIPALNIEVDEFELGKKSLGKLELIANNVGRGNSREWQLQKLAITNSDATLNATGNWAREAAGTRRMALNFTLNTPNAGNTLARLGIKEALRDGASKLEGQVQWRGSPLKIDYPSLSGQLNLSTDKGQFLKADPGVGRLIGVLSLQSLPKRLTLDFRDVFSEGFAFDSIRASAQLRNGVVSTQDFKMRGVNATVLLEGQADLARETQNLRVLVLPEINAGGASVIYGLLANPAIGIGTFLAQLVLREPLAKAFSYEYRVTGTWSDPLVERTENSKEAAAVLKDANQ